MTRFRSCATSRRKTMVAILTVVLSLAILSGVPIPAVSPVVRSQQQAAKGPASIQTEAVPVIAPGSAYRQRNLISDVPGLAQLRIPY